MMRVSIAIHIIGLVMWLGGAMIVSRCLKVFCVSYSDVVNEALGGLRQLLKKVSYGFIVPGMILSLVTGIYQISHMGMGHYMKQGWFHGKLTLVILLFVLTGLILQEVNFAAKGQVLSKKKLGMLHGFAALSLIAIVFLTFLWR